ncbi:hypothetical protein SU9_028895 [Streptomyces auratus AGR0001]|uniref:Uncharacterized protein n=1 Tax=Streptomyces auratus AGR0001 TaxID=1160718 RepID=A0A8B1PMD6_9ACTN|nr:hypothetical protein SU9_028895 [Streptomyces auratus AGR0001]
MPLGASETGPATPPAAPEAPPDRRRRSDQQRQGDRQDHALPRLAEQRAAQQPEEPAAPRRLQDPAAPREPGAAHPVVLASGNLGLVSFPDVPGAGPPARSSTAATPPC